MALLAFLDFELAFIIAPLVAGIDLIRLGGLLAVNTQTSFMHRPGQFYLRWR